MGDKKPVEEQSTASGVAPDDTLPPCSPTRLNISEPSEAAPDTQTTGKLLKDFQCTPENADTPKGDIEDKGGTALATPIPVKDFAASSTLITGSGAQWCPEMGVERFLFSHCREWRLRSDTELIVPKWSLSPALAPDTFQKYSLPFPRE